MTLDSDAAPGAMQEPSAKQSMGPLRGARSRASERDIAVLTDVWRYRYLTARQVARQRFGHVKLAQRRLRRLAEGGHVSRFRPGDASGFRAWWYRLALPGAQVVAASSGKRAEALLPPKRPPRTLGFLQHHALVTDFRIWLGEACTATDGAFSFAFVPAYDEIRVQGRRARRATLVVAGTGEQVVPDGVVLLRHLSRGSALFFVEADRGTEPLTGRHPSAIERKLTRYRAAFDAREEEQYANHFQASVRGFRLLFLVPTEQRRQAIVQLAAHLDLTPLVWVATTELVAEPGDLDAPVWAVSKDGPLHRLSE